MTTFPLSLDVVDCGRPRGSPASLMVSVIGEPLSSTGVVGTLFAFIAVAPLAFGTRGGGALSDCVRDGVAL